MDVNKVTPAAVVYHGEAFPVTWRVLPRSLHAIIDSGCGYAVEWRPYSATWGDMYIAIRRMVEAGTGEVTVDDETIELIIADFKPLKAPREVKPVNDSVITWAGKRISGKGFTIEFDAKRAKTLVYFTRRPDKAALDMMHDDKWFFRGDLKAWSKKLTVKAYKAAIKFALAMGATIPDDLPIPASM